MNSSRKLAIKHLVSTGAFASLSMVIPATAMAATISVDTTADTWGDAQQCSLRAAIESANTDTAVDGCTAGSGADEIVLQSGSTYTLSRAGTSGVDNQSADLWVDSELTLTTTGNAMATVDADGISRVFYVDTNANLTAKRIHITGGLVNPGHGGGIYMANASLVRLENSSVTDNVARGGNGTLGEGGFGGGIYNDTASLNIVDTAVSYNTARGGDGADGNSTFGTGGGGGGAGMGGGVFNNAGTVATTRAELIGNRAQGGDGGDGGRQATCGFAYIRGQAVGGAGGGDGGAGAGPNTTTADVDGNFGGGGGGGAAGEDLSGTRYSKAGGNGGYGAGAGGGNGAAGTQGTPGFGGGSAASGDGTVCVNPGGGGAGMGGAIFNNAGNRVRVGQGTVILFNEVAGGVSGDSSSITLRGGSGLGSSIYNRGDLRCDLITDELDLDGTYYLEGQGNCLSSTPFDYTDYRPKSYGTCPGSVQVNYQDGRVLGDLTEILREERVCNGQDAVTQTTTLPDGSAQCPAGGTQIDFGYDNGDGTGTAYDGVLEDAEIQSTSYICNGEDGQDGANGQDGADGQDGANGQDGADGQDGLTPVIQTTALASGDAQCPEGGTQIDVGYDDGSGTATADDGVLEDAEIQSTSYICNGQDGADGADGADGQDGANGQDGADGADGEDGADGADGQDAADGQGGAPLLVRTDELDDPDGDTCTYGGTLLETGRDTNGDGQLSDDEVESSEPLCHGIAGENNLSGSGCSSTGRGQLPISVFAILATLGATLTVRRRRRQ